MLSGEGGGCMHKPGGRGYLRVVYHTHVHMELKLYDSPTSLGLAAMLVKLGTYKVDHAARTYGRRPLGWRARGKGLAAKSALSSLPCGQIDLNLLSCFDWPKFEKEKKNCHVLFRHAPFLTVVMRFF